MSTTAQISANRQNSLLSTGPKTDAGKAASSRNAITHGFSAANPVLPHEDSEQYSLLLARYVSEFQPATSHEEFLVAQMAAARWKLDRLERIEVAMFAALESPGDPVTTDALMAQAFLDKETSSGFARLERYRTSLERTYHRSVRELRATKKEQNQKEQNKPNSAKPIENKPESTPKPAPETAPPAPTPVISLVPSLHSGPGHVRPPSAFS